MLAVAAEVANRAAVAVEGAVRIVALGEALAAGEVEHIALEVVGEAPDAAGEAEHTALEELVGEERIAVAAARPVAVEVERIALEGFEVGGQTASVRQVVELYCGIAAGIDVLEGIVVDFVR